MKLGKSSPLRQMIGVGLLLLGAARSFATSFVEQPFPDIVQDAPVIVRGKIGKTGSDWGMAADGGKRIYTLSDLNVVEVFKGRVGDKAIVIRELGGEKDGIGMHVAGASTFQKGEDVVVFLSEKNREGSYDVRGLMMGKYNLEKNKAGSEILVGPGISFRGGADDHGQNAPAEAAEWTLEALRQVIHEQAKGAASGSNTQNNDLNRPKPKPSAAGPEAASALQNPPFEVPRSSPGIASDGILSRFILVWIGLGVLAAWWIWRRRR